MAPNTDYLVEDYAAVPVRQSTSRWRFGLNGGVNLRGEAFRRREVPIRPNEVSPRRTLAEQNPVTQFPGPDVKRQSLRAPRESATIVVTMDEGGAGGLTLWVEKPGSTLSGRWPAQRPTGWTARCSGRSAHAATRDARSVAAPVSRQKAGRHGTATRRHRSRRPSGRTARGPAAACARSRSASRGFAGRRPGRASGAA